LLPLPKRRKRKTGVPKKEVTTPAGKATGSRTNWPSRSATKSITTPEKAARGKSVFYNRKLTHPINEIKPTIDHPEIAI